MEVKDGNKLGFKSTSIKFNHPNLNNIENKILLVDFQKVISDEGIPIGIWNKVYRPLSEFAETRHIVNFSPMTQAKLSIYKSISPFTAALKL